MAQNTCTEDRIQHVLERCLCDLELNTPDKQLWNAGLCMNRWCLEELVMRDPHNFPFLLHTILKKTKEVLVQCQYELVVPLTLLFSSTLLKTPYLDPDCDVLLEAYLLFHHFLSWPDPYCTACRRLLNIIYSELRAPGITFQRLVRTEQGISTENQHTKTMIVLLISPDEDIPPEVQSVSKQLSVSHQSKRDITITLILHSFQAALGSKVHLERLCHALQTKEPAELEQLLETVTCCMETAASTADLGTARQSLLQTVEQLQQSLIPTTADDYLDTEFAETFALPFPKCHTSFWENDNFDFLNNILMRECYVDLPLARLQRDEAQSTDMDLEEDLMQRNEEDPGSENYCISTASSSSRDSMLSGYCPSSSCSVSATCSSSGVESDFSEDTRNVVIDERQKSQSKLRKKPKKKSKSLIGIEHFSWFLKNPRGLGTQLKQSQSKHNHLLHEFRGSSPLSREDPPSPQKHLCIRRRPILSSNETDGAQAATLVRVLVFGRDREAGRLARAYSDLQQKEAKCPRLTEMCKLQFYFVPTKRTFGGKPRKRHSSTETGCSIKDGSLPNGISQEDSSAVLAQMLGTMDPWYDRSIHSLLSLSSDVLCQPARKEEYIPEDNGRVQHLPLMADMVLYYCRHADQPVLVQLYRAELTLSGGEKRTEVFIHSIELGHTAATRAVKAMGAASKRFGIGEESVAVPLTLSVAYNKVACSGRSQWTRAEILCTSINIHKTPRKTEHIESRTESLRLSVSEVTKKYCAKSKKSKSQHSSESEVNVNRVEVRSANPGTTFVVCLDQDERKFLQSVTRLDVSLCCKPGSSSDWKSCRFSPGQVRPLHPSYCSMLCLPLNSFSASY
ncbi:phosphoinositide 3-kinase regulatory subunit 5-like [Syngnathoides biaculeatus]|uniref:phosphoinositide 3-kinase regulatory subunit 5-like n=1 Tax=Syngnathoides biaculeatus TaxID=300417 RepID=UPI002ADDFE24|nr:phosphoinositide 3-kinase regulatory subunit 5-like [Syngnathoides biaculeatus]XP_061701508.1 phosphoinositide 3-kinase regulatory subunit 5-like [Syngnathoides biaculeatus]